FHVQGRTVVRRRVEPVRRGSLSRAQGEGDAARPDADRGAPRAEHDTLCESGHEQVRAEVHPRLGDGVRSVATQYESEPMIMTHHPLTVDRLKREDGAALIIALMATMLLTALGMTLVL